MDISVVIPLYNEEESLPELFAWIQRVMDANHFSYEVIFVNDGSTDHSWQVIEKLRSESDNVKGIKFRRNYGKSPALYCGFEKAQGDVVITMDADLQDSPDEIPELYRMITEDGYDLVSGYKQKRYDPLSKTIPTKLFNATARAVSGIKNLHDFNCGLKAYRRDVVKNIEVYGEMHRYIPYLAKNAGFPKIAEKVVHHQARKFGKTKFGGLNRFFNGLCAGTHSDENEFSIGSASVVEEVVFTARDFADLLHVAFSNFRNAVIEFVQRFTMLHKSFSRFAEGNSFRIVRVHAAFTEFANGIHIEHRTEFFIRNNFDFLDFVRRTETIEEVDNRNTTGNGRRMDDSSQVHDFLNTGFTHHADARAAHSHRIVVAGKNRVAVGSNRTRSDVENARQQFAGNLEHIAEHDHHALGGRESRREGTGIQSTVHRAGSTFFRLHFLNLYGSAKQVFTAMSSPFINVFSHRRRRRDREDGCQFRKGIGDMGAASLPIHCLKNFLCHNTVPLSVKHRNLKESVYTLESSHYIARTK